jgi:metallo-beta-lactamase class B
VKNGIILVGGEGSPSHRHPFRSVLTHHLQITTILITFHRNSFIVATFLLFSLTVQAQKVNEPQLDKPEWTAPYQPFRIAGNLYYVGTYDLACYLIHTTQGNILINTGLASSAPVIKSNIEALGFKFVDTKILLTTQAHFDHVGAMSAIKAMTGANMMAHAGDSAVVSDGGNSDYAFGGNGMMFQPVKIDRILHDKDVIKLGDTEVTVLHHPGHTKGSCSYLFETKDETRSYRVLIANMPTIVTDKSFDEIPAYPKIGDDYGYTLTVMKNLKFDVWVASHASQFGLHQKRKPGDSYNPAVFKDRAEFDEQLADLQKQVSGHSR